MKKIAVFFLLAFACVFAWAQQTGPGNVKGPGQRDIPEYVNTITDSLPCHMSNGIIVIGKGDQTRAFPGFTGAGTGGSNYADLCNLFKETFGDSVNIYCMTMPSNCEFYTPDAAVAKNWSRSERSTIMSLYSKLREDVVAVDCYTPLGLHADQNIYSRTDHHWQPLGGYYAAMALARAAKVPFKDLDAYDEHVLHGFLGTMYMYSKDYAVKANPEDFVYHTPKDTSYVTTQILLNLDRSRSRVASKGAPKKTSFFRTYKGNSSLCYMTFMGGDSYITKVETSVKNGRHILLIKDSYGNAIPGYLFYSFEEVHVIDSRYFCLNLKEYVRDNKITDIVLCNNIVFACTPKISDSIKGFLTQKSY